MNLLKKIKNNQIIPGHVITRGLMCAAVNMLVYYGAMYINKDRIKYDLTTVFDDMIIFSPSWVSIYYLAFIFWIVFYVLIMRVSKQESKRFMRGEIIGKLVCGIIYLIYPTTNIRPFINSTGFFETMVYNLYKTDLAENLLPSIHCYISWICFIGIWNVHKNYNKYSKVVVVFAGIFASLICLSTIFIKQHLIYDVLAGILLAQICFYIAHKNQKIKE